MRKILFVSIVSFFCLIPLVALVLKSVTSAFKWGNSSPLSFHLSGWKVLINDSTILHAMLISLCIASLVTTLNLVIGISAGRALAFYSFKGKSVIETFLLLPLFLPTLAAAMGLHISMIRLGLADNWVGVSLVHLIPTVPYAIKIFTSAYERLGQRMIDEAYLLGGNALHVFKSVEIPSMIQSIRSAVFLTFVISLSQYVLTAIIGGGNVITLSIIFYPFTQSANDTLMAAFSLVFAILPLIGIVVFEILIRLVFRIPIRLRSSVT
ncbi:ABC transporter permease subunit [Bacillus spongiae]|uniref:ABC transporter permease subunit n=1 Tax=Bacillus spongiae TaxID=2683610 RepID=A0ABU8HJ19_9BACI